MSFPIRHLPVLQNWDCHVCGTCCKEYQVNLTKEERKRIEAQGWDRDKDLGGFAPFVRHGPPWARKYFLRRRDGGCVFLSEAGRCRIHERFGAEAKPLACRLYPFVLVPTDDDLEGRAITARILGLFFARDEQARRHLVTRDVGAAWRASAFVGNWFLELTPEEADALAERLAELVQELRARPQPTPGADRALVSISVLPWLD